MVPIRGVLLDIDGTLVDNNDAHARAWVQALAESGRTVAFDDVRPFIGMGGDKLLPKVCGLDAESAEGNAVSERRGDLFLSEFPPDLRPCRGASALLARMASRGLRLAVASSAKEKELAALLKICGTERLRESATSSDDAGRSKPDADILHVALNAIGLRAAEAVMLGNTPTKWKRPAAPGCGSSPCGAEVGTTPI